MDSTATITPQAPVSFSAVSDGAVNVRIDDRLRYQTFDGVGASFTDSSAYLLTQLKDDDPQAYADLMSEVFDPDDGLGMSLWRIPMGASDFTATSYHWTNADTQGPPEDPTAYFALTSRDTEYIIPVVLDALAINPDLMIVASPWSAPGWMKTNDSIICKANGSNGSLRTQYQQAWADYFRKWIQAYEAAGVPIWAITPQNEPEYCPDSYPGMVWTATAQVSWIESYLAPTLAAADLDPEILGWDQKFAQARTFPQTTVDQTSASVVGGIAWHCYGTDAAPAYMTKVHSTDPSRSVYETECSSNVVPTPLIKYSTAEMALLSFQNWAQGVILWNFALDASGGPHLGGCEACYPLVQVDEGTPTTWTYHRNLAHLGQISGFVQAGATRIDSTENAHGIVTAAFENPDGEEVVVATNTTASPVTFRVTWNFNGSFDYTLPSRASVTFVADVPSASAPASAPEVDGTYTIVSRVSGKPVSVCGASTDNGACIAQRHDNGDADQRWTLADAGSGYVNVVNSGSGKALDNPGGSTADGTQMQQWAITGAGDSNQQWLLTPVGDGWYTVVNRTSGKALTVRDGSAAEGAAIEQRTFDPGSSSQQFRFVTPSPTTPAIGKTYHIESRVSGKPVSVCGASTDNGACIAQRHDNGDADQRWTLADAGSGYVNVVNSGSGKALDNPGGSTADGTQIQQWAITGAGNSNQQWLLTPVGDGWYTVVNRTSGKALDLEGGSVADGVAIQQWTLGSSNPNQQFAFVPYG